MLTVAVHEMIAMLISRYQHFVDVFDHLNYYYYYYDYLELTYRWALLVETVVVEMTFAVCRENRILK
jgi:hypothetical protein